MASDGPNYPNQFTNHADETYEWADLNGMEAVGFPYAACNAFDCPNGTYPMSGLSAYDFGFSIPSGATIDGVILTLNLCASHNAARYVSITSLLIRISGGTAGDDKATPATKWGTTFGDWVYGDATDDWNASLDDADVNSNQFGFYLKAQFVNGMAIQTMWAQIDYATMEVYYTAGAVAGRATRSVAMQPLMVY